MGILDDWYERAAATPRRIVLADDDPRAHEAAARLRNDGLAEPVVIGRDLASLADAAHPEADELVAELAAVTDGPWAGRPLDIDDPLTIATALVKSGWADGAVAGATRPTGDVIRAGIRVLDVAPDVSIVSSSFFFVLPDGRPLVYGDCGVLPDPTADQLAAVAISSAATFAQLAGEEPADGADGADVGLMQRQASLQVQRKTCDMGGGGASGASGGACSAPLEAALLWCRSSPFL